MKNQTKILIAGVIFLAAAMLLAESAHAASFELIFGKNLPSDECSNAFDFFTGKGTLASREYSSGYSGRVLLQSFAKGLSCYNTLDKEELLNFQPFPLTGWGNPLPEDSGQNNDIVTRVLRNEKNSVKNEGGRTRGNEKDTVLYFDFNSFFSEEMLDEIFNGLAKQQAAQRRNGINIGDWQQPSGRGYYNLGSQGPQQYSGFGSQQYSYSKRGVLIRP